MMTSTSLFYNDVIDPVQCSLQVGGVSLKKVKKFRYLGVTFTSDERQDKKIGCSIIQSKCCNLNFAPLVVLKQELSRKAKLSIFKPIFVPILTCGYDRKSAITNANVRNEIFANDQRCNDV